jgi:hypothetical protein
MLSQSVERAGRVIGALPARASYGRCDWPTPAPRFIVNDDIRFCKTGGFKMLNAECQ